jgi:hypothetical protein
MRTGERNCTASPTRRARTMAFCAAGALLLSGLAPAYTQDKTEKCGDWIIYHARMGEYEEVMKLERAGCAQYPKSQVATGILSSLVSVKMNDSHRRLFRHAIENGADVNSWGPEGPILLACCLNSQNKELAMLLIEHGANVKGRAENGSTVLHEAVRGNNFFDVVKMLLDRGADIEARDRDGDTPLMSLASCGGTDTAIARLLIERGCRLEAQGNKLGWTPLVAAASIRNNEILEVLIEKGAKINHRDKRGSTALDWAVSHGHGDTAEILRNHGAKSGRALKGGAM